MQPSDTTYLNRIVTVIRRLIRSEFSNYNYLGRYEYNIQSVEGDIINANPTDTTLPLPSVRATLKPSLLGETVTPTPGKLCHVMFLNGSPAKPIVVSCEGDNVTSDISSTAPLTIQGGVLPAARATDPILAAGIFAGTIVSGSTKTLVG